MTLEERSLTVHRNEVLLVGRVSMCATRRELPSGDIVSGIRIVVERDPESLHGRTARIDAIDCVAWSEQWHDEMRRWELGDVVEVVGALRRRFRRTEAGTVSRYEVEVQRARLIGATADGARPHAESRNVEGQDGGARQVV
ncbi:single-stranded DNA-binding protein [Actinopolymorpha sp. B9G3]|uniref:single-stranded DNA-binding protein n=1 Tax=Actinopolymorpha sp. B9G3 TaxID=3158970 RepID=UPI0032D8F7AC